MSDIPRKLLVKETAVSLEVSRSAYYRWARNGVSQRRKTTDAELVRLILEIVTKRHRRYGSSRVRRELRDVYGKRVSLKKAARLMRENGLNAGRRRISSTPLFSFNVLVN